MEFQFPQYRKYSNNKNFFKIISQTEFDEINFIGKKISVTKHVAKILPDRNFISDLLLDVGSTCVVATEQEYQLHLKL